MPPATNETAEKAPETGTADAGPEVAAGDATAPAPKKARKDAPKPSGSAGPAGSGEKIFEYEYEGQTLQVRADSAEDAVRAFNGSGVSKKVQTADMLKLRELK